MGERAPTVWEARGVSMATTTTRLHPTTDPPRPRSLVGEDARRRAYGRVVVVVVVVFVLVRAAFFVEQAALPEWRAPILDALFHDHLARFFAGLDATLPDDVDDPDVAHQPFARPPAYPLALGALYATVGDHWLWPRVLQGLVSLALALLVLALSLRARLHAIAAAGSALLVVASPSLVFFEGELMPEAPLALAVLALVVVAERAIARGRTRDLLALGLVIGALTVARPNLLLPGALVAVVVVAHLRARRAVCALACALACAVPVAPIVARHLVVADAFVPVATNGATTLLYGNNPRADGVRMLLPDEPPFDAVRDVSPFSAERTRRVLSASVGRELSSSEVGDLFVARALRFAREEPARLARLTWRKALLVVGPEVIGNNRDVAGAIEESRVLAHLPASFRLLWPLALLGVVASARTRRRRAFRAEARVRAAVVVGTLASIVPFVVAERFRLPLVGVLALFAGHFLDDAVRAWRARFRDGFAPIALRATALLGLCAVFRLPLVDVLRDDARVYFERARAHARLGEHAESARVLERALALSPDSPAALREKGFQALAPDPEHAHALFDRVLSVDSDDGRALFGRGSARLAMGDVRGARDDLDAAERRLPGDMGVLYNRALARAALGDHAGATSDLTRVLDEEPGHVDARNNLGRARLAMGDVEGALDAFAAVLSRAPRHSEARFNLTVALTRLGRTGEAARALDALLDDEPTNARALMNRGALLMDGGDARAALPFFERARAHAPGLVANLMNLARAHLATGEAERALAILDDADRAVARGGDAPPLVARTELRVQALLAAGTPAHLDEAHTRAAALARATKDAPGALRLLLVVDRARGADPSSTIDRLTRACARGRAQGDPACDDTPTPP